ncbi:PhzF family phenazine biosynthesis protein [Streptomyces sp. NPDC051940]|uniref:PhzF family phenazine biosynthesis protein n=1 Tax=Streptomyces sp. NPDC051940 TaxID=3155675 RepID=UPI00344A86D5
MHFHVVDAFTNRPFAGNPAAVFVLPPDTPWPRTDDLQRTAAELNLPETVYVRPAAAAAWDIRWFTPTLETNLCGHATLAARHVLREEHGIVGEVRFHSFHRLHRLHSRTEGVLTADAPPTGPITLDFPRAELTPTPVPDGLTAALGGIPVLETYRTGTLGDLLAVLPDKAAVASAAPDQAALMSLQRGQGLRGVIITARADDPGTPAAPDFVSRYFAPLDGIPEDPVTGSAHTALTPYWSSRLGRTEFTAHQLSARGGVLTVSLHGDRVRLRGEAITVIAGELRVRPGAGRPGES